MKTQKAPIPSQNLIDAAMAVLTARAAVETLRPVVEKIQADILINHEFIYVDRYAHRAADPVEAAKPQRLTEFRLAYYLADEDSEKLFEMLEAEYIRAGFTEGREAGQCPLLICQSLESAATSLFITVSQELQDALDVKKLDAVSCEHRKQYVELTLNYVGKFLKRNNN